MDLLQYDCKWVPEIFAMHNSGVICYLNSLIQSLLCLPAFNKFLVDHEVNFSAENNALGLALLDLFRNTDSPDASHKLSTRRVDVILRELLAKRKMHAMHNSIGIGSQEDAHEGYQLLLNSIVGLSNQSMGDANDLEMNFHIRHDTIISCRACKTKRKSMIVDGNRERGMPPEIFIEIPYYDEFYGHIDTQEKMQNYINSQSSFPPDLRCEKCGAQNTEGRNVILNSYVLRRLSSVIVIVFKNYPSINGSKVLHYFPSGLQFKSDNGVVIYQAMAKIEHFGSERGGHYIAVGQRKVHPRIQEARLANMRQRVTQLESQGSADEVKIIKRQIRNADRETSIFRMDDLRVTYMNDGIVPTENTYMVFYHFMQRT
jgi:uncharacterized UBP type Zn finger protein